MKSQKLSIVGQVNESGKLLIANKIEMNDFFAKWPKSRVLMEATVYKNEPSRALIGLYMKKVVPDFQKAILDKEGERLTLPDVDLRLRKLSPVCREDIPSEESNGFELVRLKTVYDLEGSELVEFVDHVISMAARDYGYVIQTFK